MLDAAHGEAVGANVGVRRADVGGTEHQAAGPLAARERRRRPAKALRTDVRQGSRRPGAEARS